jgi:predicted dehydrogenase
MIPNKVELFYDYRSMLDKIRPDAAIVISKNNEHLEILKECASRNIDYFTHKPIATSYKDALEMKKIERKTDIKIMINYYPLWRPEFQELYRQYESGVTGPIFKFTSYNGHQGPKGLGTLSDDYINWLYNPVQHGGGVLIDQGTYGLNCALWFMGHPQSVFANAFIMKPWENDVVEDDSVIMLKYSNGTAVIHGSNDFPFVRRMVELYGLRGGLRLYDDILLLEKAYKPEKPDKKETIYIDVPKVPVSWKNGIAHFIDCIRHNREIYKPHTVDFNVMVAEVTEAAYKSVKSGKAINLSKKINHNTTK